MSALPRLPELLPTENAEALSRAVAGLEPTALWWLSGYAAGLAHARSGSTSWPAAVVEAQPAAAAEAVAAARLSIVYGSQTGNAKRCAEALAREAEAQGLSVRLLRADAYPLRELKDERLLTIVISTQGEGDPPDDALALVEFLSGRRAPELGQLRYAVLGLGDSSYARFCEIGRRIDARLAELGAQRVIERADADVDIEAVAKPWRQRLLHSLRDSQEEAAPLAQPRATVTPLRRPPAPSHHREAPFAAELISQQPISGRGSDKDVRHLEFDLAGAGLHYEPGDALAVWPQQAPALVEAVLKATALDGETPQTLNGQVGPLRYWLGHQRELARGGRGLLQALAQQHAELNTTLERSEATAAWLARYPLLSALERWPRQWTGESLLAALRPLTPRLYSLASSRAEVGDEAHLCIDVVRYAAEGRIHVGTASNQLARLVAGDRMPVYVEANERFRLPADGQRDLIMIGAGTGVAPYRGFLQQRVADGARGRHWLLFGAQRFASDFLYQAEWLKWRQLGKLQRIDVAFSRDQASKIYVQQRLAEQARTLWEWLQGGAHLYVCGSVAMGRDVHTALLSIAQQHLGGVHDKAEEWLRALQQSGRYHKDVY